MSKVLFQGELVNIAGSFPTKGDKAPDFNLCTDDLTNLSLKSLKGKKVVLNIFPSIDTPVCALSVKKFNQNAVDADAYVLCISSDLPFASTRFCQNENIKSVKMLSTFRSPSFAEDYGVKIKDGPLGGLSTRAVIVIDENGQILHSELVEEITNEPNYKDALIHLGKIA